MTFVCKKMLGRLSPGIHKDMLIVARNLESTIDTIVSREDDYHTTIVDDMFSIATPNLSCMNKEEANDNDDKCTASTLTPTLGTNVEEVYA